jgi:hypothetical protein
LEKISGPPKFRDQTKVRDVTGNDQQVEALGGEVRGERLQLFTTYSPSNVQVTEVSRFHGRED